MFLSLSSWIFGHLPAKEMLRKVCQCGYRHVEISASHWPEKWKWRELCSAADDLGVRILSAHCCHHEIPEGTLDEGKYREYHEQFYANMDGVEGLLVVEHELGRFDESREVARAEMLRELARLHGLVVTFENMAAPPEKLRKLVELDGLFFTFDPMHAAVLAKIEPLCYAGLFPRLVNVHAMDKIKSPSLGHAVPCGLGELGWPDIIRALALAGYKGPVTVEMEMSPVRRVMELCRSVYALAQGPDSVPRQDLDIEEAFAVYARKYLEAQILRAKTPHD